MKCLPKDLTASFYSKKLLDEEFFFEKCTRDSNHLRWKTRDKWKFLSSFSCLFNIIEAFHVFCLSWCHILTDWSTDFFQQYLTVNKKKRLNSLMLCSWMDYHSLTDCWQVQLADILKEHWWLYHQHHSSSWWVVLTPPVEMRLCLASTLTQCRPLCL